MIQYTRTYTRPTLQTPWHTQVVLPVSNATFAARMRDLYFTTGKCIGQTLVESVGRLELIYTGNWLDEASYNEYDIDPVLNTYWAVKDLYNTGCGIIKGPLSFKTV